MCLLIEPSQGLACSNFTYFERQAKREDVILHLCCWETGGQGAVTAKLTLYPSPLLYMWVKQELVHPVVICGLLHTLGEEKESRPPCLPSVNHTSHPPRHWRCLLQTANLQVQPQVFFLSEVAENSLNARQIQAEAFTLVRDQETCSSRAYSTIGYAFLIPLLFSHTVIAVTTPTTPLCKLNISAHLFHHPPKWKHRSEYELRLDWVYSAFD